MLHIRYTICAVYKSTEQSVYKRNMHTVISIKCVHLYIQKLVPVFADPGSES